MSVKFKTRLVSHPKFALLASAALIAFADAVMAFSGGSASGAAKGTCVFTQQLQTSVAARRLYLVKLEQAVTKGQTVEGMYASAEQAALAESEEESAPAGRFWKYGAGRTATATSIDSFSADCITCHDGVSASTIAIDLRNRPYDRQSWVTSSSSDHPIGMDYNSYVNANRGYKRVLPNSNKMVFVNGKVGCLTCHDPLNPEKGHLVMSDRNSALCQTCHNK